MASRAILASPLAVCLRCQLRSSGFLPHRSLYAARKVPMTRLLPISHRRWNSAQAETAGQQPVEENQLADPARIIPIAPVEATPATTGVVQENETTPVEVKEGGTDGAPVEGLEGTTPITTAETTVSAPVEGLEETTPITTVETTVSAADETPTPKKRRGLAQLENRKLLILQMPAPRPRRRAVPLSAEVDDEELDQLSSNLLVFEKESTPDASQFAISLLKPFGVTRVSKLRYQQLFDQLLNQFNKDQLQSYISFVREKIQKKDARVGKGTKKVDLGTVILKEIWGVQIDEEISEREDLIIQKRLPMSKEDIYFLIGQNGRNLRRWAQEFHARITVNVQESFVEFEAVEANIEALEKKIPEHLDQKISEDIDLSAISRITQFNKAYVSGISTMTETYIHNISDHIYRVLALGPSTAPIEDARRLIFDSHELQFRRSYSLAVDSSFSPGAEDAGDLRGALYSAVEDRSLPWMLRGKDWARWRSVKGKVPDLTMSPIQQKISSLIKAATQSPENPKPIDRWEKAQASLETTDLTQDMETVKALLDDGISTSPELPPPSYSATLGYVLHNSGMEQRKLNTLESVLNAGSERVFCENIPGLTYATSRLNLVDEAASAQSWGLPVPDGWTSPTGNSETPARTPPTEFRKHTLVLKFSPSPWAHPDSFESYPPVEMILELDPVTGEYKNPQVLAMESNSMADLMLPSKECDIRFKRRVDVPLYLGGNAMKVDFETTHFAPVITKPPTELQEAHQAKVEEFLKASKLNPLKDDRLRAVPEIELFVPNYICFAPREAAEVEAQDGLDQAVAEGETEAMENLEEVIEEADAAVPVEAQVEEDDAELAELLEESDNSIPAELAEEAAEESLLDTAEEVAAETEIEEAAKEQTHGEEALESTEEVTSEDGEMAAEPTAPTESETTTIVTPPAPAIHLPSDKYTPVKYVFTNISHHTTTSVSYAGYRLQKKLIEGGVSGGKRTEIETLFTRVKRPAMADRAPDWAKFTEDMLELVRKMGVMVRSGGTGVFKKEDRAAVDVGKLALGLQEERTRSGGARARKVISTPAVEKLIAGRELEGSSGPLIRKVASWEKEPEEMSAKERVKKERKERRERKLRAELENAQKQKQERENGHESELE
ncbi:mitochondrial inner-membrane-bound regulator-domain-containing protein [Peziza echinospora]|nr:mitochondrial inner-membrane-bound regulator-domain-containing protein [Peziza echinospora]